MRDVAPLEQKLAGLKRLLAAMPRCLVAFSGGVDSTFLLAVAREVLGERAFGVTARSESLPGEELAAAVDLARRIGAPHRVIETRELDDPDYAKNAPDRCYHCKSELFAKLAPLAAEVPGTVVVYGELADDAAEARPGRRAAREAGARAPLAEAQLTKADVRELSRRYGLPTADKPALACLASRVPYFTPVSAELLGRIERAEAGLHRLGFPEVRVRAHGDVARVEVPAARVAEIAADPLRERALAAVRAAGFRYVAVDLAGYRSGSLNEALLPLPVVAGAGPSGLPPAARE